MRSKPMLIATLIPSRIVVASAININASLIYLQLVTMKFLVQPLITNPAPVFVEDFDPSNLILMAPPWGLVHPTCNMFMMFDGGNGR